MLQLLKKGAEVHWAEHMKPLLQKQNKKKNY